VGRVGRLKLEVRIADFSLLISKLI
jgi:hypothetical protein